MFHVRRSDFVPLLLPLLLSGILLASCEKAQPPPPALEEVKKDDPKTLLSRVVSATREIKSFKAKVVLHKRSPSGKPSDYEAIIKLKRPNLARVEITEAPTGTWPPYPGIIASDRFTVSVVDNHRVTYVELPPDPEGASLARSRIDLVDFLLHPSLKSLGIKPTARVTSGGWRNVEGTRYQIVKVVQEGPMPSKSWIFVGPDNLIHRITKQVEGYMRTSDGEQRIVTIKSETVLVSLTPEAGLSEADFGFEPPESARLSVPRDSEAGLIPVGEPVPSLTLPSLDGEPVSLDDLSQYNKAVLLNFWFYG